MNFRIFMACCMIMSPLFPGAQTLTLLPSGHNKRASVSERVGITDVTIDYSRPGVKGRDGKIWGELIPMGLSDQGFGSSSAAPWRAGANENTTIEFSTDVTIDGQSLPAGKYGFFIIYGPDESTLVFSKNATSWGSFYYNQTEDALRVKVKPEALPSKIEWLKYEFMQQTDSTAQVGLEWEKLMIPFTIGVDYKATQLTLIHQQLRSEKAFVWQSWDEAAQWCVKYNTNLNEALLWTDSATGQNFGGSSSFTAWSTKAMVLDKLGRDTEAVRIMKQVLPLGSMQELHTYARALLAEKKYKDALEVFTLNYKKNPGQYMPLIGLARGYSAAGDYKTALKYAQLAEPLVTDPPSKLALTGFIAKLKNGQDIN